MNDSSTTLVHVAALPATEVLSVLAFLAFAVWVIYTLIAGYHWLRYSNNTTLALSAMTTHLVVSAWLAIYAVSGLVH